MPSIGPGRFVLGMAIVLFSVYLIDQYNAKLANAYIAILSMAMLLVFSEEFNDFGNWLTERL